MSAHACTSFETLRRISLLPHVLMGLQSSVNGQEESIISVSIQPLLSSSCCVHHGLKPVMSNVSNQPTLQWHRPLCPRVLHHGMGQGELVAPMRALP